jgi:RNA polymerase sigma factor (sigma-70 family)
MLDLSPEQYEWARRIACSVARRLPPSFELDDLIQIAYFEAWLAFQDYDQSRGVPFTSFAYRRVQGACLMSVRRRHWANGTHGELEQALFSILRDESASVVEDLMCGEELAAVETAIKELPYRERRAINMHYRKGHTWGYVAEKMGVSETTVFAIRTKAIATLRVKLGASE